MRPKVTCKGLAKLDEKCHPCHLAKEICALCIMQIKTICLNSTYTVDDVQVFLYAFVLVTELPLDARSKWQRQKLQDDYLQMAL